MLRLHHSHIKKKLCLFFHPKIHKNSLSDYVTHHITKYSVLTWYVWIKNKLVDRHVGGFCDSYWRLNEDQVSSLSTLQTSQINIDKQCPWQYRTVLYNELTVICHFRHWSLKRKEQVSEYSDHKEQMKGSIISLSFLWPYDQCTGQWESRIQDLTKSMRCVFWQKTLYPRCLTLHPGVCV